VGGAASGADRSIAVLVPLIFFFSEYTLVLIGDVHVDRSCPTYRAHVPPSLGFPPAEISPLLMQSVWRLVPRHLRARTKQLLDESNSSTKSV